MAADDMTNSAIAEQLEVSNPTIADGCRRYIADGTGGVYDLPPDHRRRTYDDDEVALLMQQALDQRPVDATHWGTGTCAHATQVSKSTAHRYVRLFGIQPHRTRTFKLSTDPFFIEKVHSAAALPRSFHADLRVFAQSSRALVRQRQPARHVPKRQAAHRPHPAVRRSVQRPVHAIPLGRNRRFNLANTR